MLFAAKWNHDVTHMEVSMCKLMIFHLQQTFWQLVKDFKRDLTLEFPAGKMIQIVVDLLNAHPLNSLQENLYE